MCVGIIESSLSQNVHQYQRLYTPHGDDGNNGIGSNGRAQMPTHFYKMYAQYIHENITLAIVPFDYPHNN